MEQRATCPTPTLFVAMYVRREAVLSSQIEGTQSSLDDVLSFEVDAPDANPTPGHHRNRQLRPRYEPWTRPP